MRFELGREEKTKKVMWKSKEHVVWRIKGDLLVILDTVSGHYYTQ